MLARVAKYMMCNRQVEAVKPFREPFKVIPRPGNKGNKSPQQAVLRQEILQKLGRQRLDRTFEVLRGRSVPKFKVYDANNELLIAQRTQVNPMLTESNDNQKCSSWSVCTRCPRRHAMHYFYALQPNWGGRIAQTGWYEFDNFLAHTRYSMTRTRRRKTRCCKGEFVMLIFKTKTSEALLG